MLSTLLEWLLVCSPFLIYLVYLVRKQRRLRRQLRALRRLVDAASGQFLTVDGDVYDVKVIETKGVIPAHEIASMKGAEVKYRHHKEYLRGVHLSKLDRLAREKLIVWIEQKDPPGRPLGFHLMLRSVVAIPLETAPGTYTRTVILPMTPFPDLESWPKQSSLSSLEGPPA